MKHTNFIFKLLSLMIVLGVLVYYQNIAQVRAARVQENQMAVAEVEAYNAKILGTEIRKEVQYLDGSYEGVGIGFGGEISVRVTISEKQITEIEVLSHSDEDTAYYELAKSVVDDVLKVQNTNVDTVSGATFSSLGLLEAIDNALEQAVE